MIMPPNIAPITLRASHSGVTEQLFKPRVTGILLPDQRVIDRGQCGDKHQRKADISRPPSLFPASKPTSESSSFLIANRTKENESKAQASLTLPLDTFGWGWPLTLIERFRHVSRSRSPHQYYGLIKRQRPQNTTYQI